MGKKTVTRVLCMALAVLFLVSSAVIAVSADGNETGESILDKFAETANSISYDSYIDEHKELFHAAEIRTGNEPRITFDATKNWVYYTGGFGKDDDGVVIGKGNQVQVDPVNGWTLTVNGNTFTKDEAVSANYNLDALARLDTYDGVNAVYTPSTGSISWTLDLTAAGITEPGLYSISLIYYPVEGKAASIEREFFINYEVPFSEARSLTIAKLWGSYLQSGNDISSLYAIYSPTKKVLKKNPNQLADVKQEAEDCGLVCTYSEDGTYLKIEQPSIVTSKINEFLKKYDLRFFETDDNNNELRPTMKQSPEWLEYTLRDGGGYYANQFGFYIEPSGTGTVTLTLAGVNEPMALSQIVFTPYTTLNSYKQYLADLQANGVDITDEGTDQVKIEGEYSAKTSTNVIYPVEDRASALTSPSDTTRTLLNTIGTEKWETAGQWAEYRFTVNDSGMYDIFSRFKQSYLDGLYVSRSLQIFTNYSTKAAYQAAHGSSAGYYDGLPFAEAGELRYDYGNGWQVTRLTNSRNKVTNKEPQFPLYFKEGVVYTIRFEVTLGSMSENVRKLEDILEALNTDYLDIIKLTGSSPDTYRDYNFSSLLPETLIDMIRQSRALTALSEELKENTASTYTGICDKLANLIEDMGYHEDTIAKNLSNFKSYVGSLGTFLTDAKTQPLQLDYLVIQRPTGKAPKANSNFFVSFAHEFAGFMQSFFRDYNSMGARSDDSTTESVNVWLAYGRDQAQVIRNLATNDFTPNSDPKIAVDLKLVSGGTLLPSILAGMGPDAYIGLGQAEVINYAIRGALMNIEGMEGFDEVAANFNDAAMVVLRMDDADGISHCYGLPENQQFPMMFVRLDILSSLDIEIPETWEDVYVAQSKLEANNMEIGVTTNYKILLYQMGGELFADNGMRINLNSKVGLDAFETMCNMFTEYSFPYSYNAANRFRTGEMPIIISDYTALYNHLKVFATELDGTWSFVPLPGYRQEDGSINNCSVSSVTAAVIIKGKNNKDYSSVWKFVKWYTDAPCQVQYATEMVAIIGDSAKHSTANYKALKEMPWTEAERAEVEKQFSNLASIPNYPGYYYIDRYTNFAFLAAYNNGAVAREELLRYINTINKEITRKREEFNLETLEIGQTLLQKRSDQATVALDLLAERCGATNPDNKYHNAYKLAKYGITNRHLEQVKEAALAFAQQLDTEDGKTAEKIISERLNPDTVAQRTTFEKLKDQSWFVPVSKQTAATKNGGYKIESLKENELVYFITECLCNIAVAIQTY